MTQHNPSDSDLIKKYNSGDKTSLVTLVKRWHKIFFEKAYWVLQDKELSKDVVQECWIIIIDRLNGLKKPESFKSWALRIIYTKSIDAHKHRAKARYDSSLKANQNDSTSQESGENTDLKRKLYKAIQKLPDDKQDVIRLFYVEEYTLREISSFLDVPLGTVKSRLFKAREKLKSIIK